MATTGSVYNHSRSTRQILKRHRKGGPSFSLHLHPTWFRFDDPKGRLILEEAIPEDASSSSSLAGPSRLPVHGVGKADPRKHPMTPGRELLRCIRDQKVPNMMLDVLDMRKIPFYEGCLIVEIKDYRRYPSDAATEDTTTELKAAKPSTQVANSLAIRLESGRYGLGPSSRGRDSNGNHLAELEDVGSSSNDPRSTVAKGPETYRVVLHPNEETLWAELQNLNDRLAGGTWSDAVALEVESKILNLTSPPLCLTPDPHATRVANLMLAATAPIASYAPSNPLPHQRLLPPLEPLPSSSKLSAKLKSGLSDAELQKEHQALLEKKRREALMRIMEGGWKMTAKDKKNPGRTGQAQLPNSSNASHDSFVPTFHRLNFIERYRSAANKAQAKANGEAAAAAAVADTSVDAARREDGGRPSLATSAGGSSTNVNAASTNGAATTAKKTATKKRKKQDGEIEETREEEAAASKSKKKKTANAASKAGSPEVIKMEQAAAPVASSPEQKSKPKSKAATKKAREAEAAAAAAAAAAAGSPTATDAPTPSVNGDADASTSSIKGGAKKAPAAKKAPVKKTSRAAASKTTISAAAIAARHASQQSTPALGHAAMPQPSPSRHAPSPYGSAGNMATPSPAMSHAGSHMGNNFGGLGIGLPMGGFDQQQQGLPNNPLSQQQQQAAAAAVAAQFSLPVGVGMGMQGLNGTNNMPNGGLSLPFGQASTGFSNNGNFPNNGGFSLPMGNGLATPGGTPNLTQAQVLQGLTNHPNFSNLPPQFQQQVFAWQQSQANAGGQRRGMQQQQGQGNMQLPPGWPSGNGQ